MRASLLLIVAACASANHQQPNGSEAAPPSRREEVRDVVQGVTVTDPYRWLEKEKSPEVEAWMRAQDEFTRPRLKALPGHDAFARRLKELLYFDSVEAPAHRGNRYFYSRKPAAKEKSIPVDPSQFDVEQVFTNSKDGTRLPLFLVHKKGAAKTGATPTILYGYGGFLVSEVPKFSASLYPWLEAGGVYVLVNLRGGGEYGEEWHRAGMLEHKQNVFDDFIAAGEYLVREKWTDSPHLAIRGGSNGGLLVRVDPMHARKFTAALQTATTAARSGCGSSATRGAAAPT